VVMFWGGQTSMQVGGQRAGKPVRFTYEDLQAIRDEVPLVKSVSAEYDDTMGFKRGNRVVSVNVKAIQFPYGEMRRLEVGEGRYFEESDFTEHRSVVIFGPNAAKKVFAGTPPVGQSVSIRGRMFQVIGLLKLKIQDSSNNGPDNENVFMPFETMRDITDARNPQMIVFQPISADNHMKAIDAVRAVLARRHNFNPKDDKATPTWDTIENLEDIQKFSLALQIMLGFIGALTLGVGGIGVMNIMLVTVTERTREIGLRKALGARPRDIASQFLIEALVLTFLAGAAGMVLAAVLAQAIPPMPLYSAEFKTANHEGDIILRTSTTVMLASFIILSAVGIFSGMWPALKAARMDPVDALRYE
jgi:putative ABC transport system permease protein